MTRTLITGVSGFVGQHLVEHLHGCGHRVIGVSRSIPTDARRQGLLAGFHRAGLDDVEVLCRIIEDEKVDAIVHLASTRQAASPSGIYEANMLGASRLLESATRSRRPVRVVLVGSSAMYGESIGKLPQDEHAVVAPVSAYGVSKAAVDLMGQQVFRASGLAVLRLRPFNIIGPHQRGDYVTAKCAQQLAEIEQGLRPPVVRLGNLDAVRDFLDVRDLSRAVERVLELGRPGEAYNVCSGRPVSVRSLIQMFLERASGDIALESQPASTGDVPFQVGSYAKLQSETAWEPSVTLAQTVDDILHDWRAEIAASKR